MAVDKLVDSSQLDADLTSVANAIRTKGGTSASLTFPAEFVSAIASIPSGGSIPSRLIDFTEITFASTATSDNKLSVQLTPATNGCVCVVIKEMPSVPDDSEYIPVIWSYTFTDALYTNVGYVIRPDGTIGTDKNMCSFNKTTGVLLVGGQYGHFLAGTDYQIFEMGV